MQGVPDRAASLKAWHCLMHEGWARVDMIKQVHYCTAPAGLGT
jgi:hypothetical protein